MPIGIYSNTCQLPRARELGVGRAELHQHCCRRVQIANTPAFPCASWLILLRDTCVAREESLPCHAHIVQQDAKARK